MSAICLALLSSFGCSRPNIIRIKVTDTDNVPVPNAKIVVGWQGALGGLSATPGGGHSQGTGDAKGEYTFFGFTGGEVSVGASKEGFYSGFTDDPKKVVLRRKEHPIPMFAKRVWLNLPTIEGDLGYDLFLGDLVAPYGTGQQADFIFRLAQTNAFPGVNGKRLLVEIVFSNLGDGIQPVFVPNMVAPSSEYQLPFTAPETGYSSSLSAADADFNRADASKCF
jgi:hypothetical protein